MTQESTSETTRVYKDEVLGDRVSIQFLLKDEGDDDDERFAFFDGMVRAVTMDFVPENGTVETTHCIHFDDGDRRDFDLAEQEKAGHLKWIGRDRKPAPKEEGDSIQPLVKQVPKVTGGSAATSKKKSTRKKGAGSRKRRPAPVTPQRTKKQRTIEGGVSNDYWIEEMYGWLLTVPHGPSHKVVSEANAKSVMRQVKKLASGNGITYSPWPEGTVFCENKRLDLDQTNRKKFIWVNLNEDVDFDELHQEAVHYEEEYGKDKGHGWLMRHPVKKLELYEAYLQEDE